MWGRPRQLRRAPGPLGLGLLQANTVHCRDPCARDRLRTPPCPPRFAPRTRGDGEQLAAPGCAPAGKLNAAMRPRELKGSGKLGDASTPAQSPVSEAEGAGRGRWLHLPLVTPPRKMAAMESSDSEEEDLVSYGSALQPLQEGKGPPGGSSAPSLFLCECVVASPGEQPGVRRCCRDIPKGLRGPARV